MHPDSIAHILVLEDDETLREILSELLEDEGYRVSAAGSGASALELADREPIDFLIFDIRMEGMSGLEAFQRMRQLGLDLPSLAITGFAGDDDPIRALKLGVGDYLRKPFQPEQLLESVARLLAQHRARVDNQRCLTDLRRLAVWTAGQLTSNRELVERVEALGEAGELLPAEGAELVLSGLVSAHNPDGLAGPDAPPGLQRWKEWVDLARVSLQFPAGEGLAERILRRHPGTFDPQLVAALDRMRTNQNQDARGLLALAQGLLGQGQNAAAVQALEKAVELGELATAVKASLLLGQLALPAPEKVSHWVRRAVELARQQGPVAAARAMQSAALLMRRAQLPEAEAALRQAAQRLAELGMAAEAAVVELYLGTRRVELLDLLMRHENEPQLAAEIDGLFPLLCEFTPPLTLKRLILRYPWLTFHHAEHIPAELQQPSEPAQSVLRIDSFGGLRISWAGTPLEEALWRGPLVKYLLAFLVRSHKPVHESHILDAFWPDGHENSRRRLSGALSAIRRALAQATGVDQDPIVRSREYLSLADLWPVWHDVREFEAAHLKEDWPRMQALYQGAYLEGCYMDWAVLQRQKFEEQMIKALHQLAVSQLEKQPERALEAAQRALSLDPCQQGAQLNAMRAHMRLGQPEKALRDFDRFTQLLRRELDVEPTTELLECYQRARLALP